MSLLCTFTAAAKAVRSTSSNVSSSVFSWSTCWFSPTEGIIVSFKWSEPRRLDDSVRDEGPGVDVGGGVERMFCGEVGVLGGADLT